MPTVEIPLFTRSYKNADGVVLTDDAAIQYNGYIDGMTGMNIRPGEVLAKNPVKRIDGLMFWPDKNLILCVEEGATQLRTVSGETLVDYGSQGAVTVLPDNLATFANQGDYVFMAGGAKISYVDATGAVTELADADAPQTVTHVEFLDGYILAINGDGKFYWADVNSPTNWSALSFASAEANPDVIKCIKVVQRQIYLLGTVSTEIWENDGETPFSRIPGGAIEMGCIAKYSPIKRGNSLMWLNHDRQFVEFTGTSIKFVSNRYDKELSNFSYVEDCIGSVIIKDGQEFCVFSFPTEQRTLAYNPAIDDWSEWGTWNSEGEIWQPYDIRCSARDLQTGKVFVGKGSAKSIACLNSDSRVDITDTGTRAFKFLRKTGFIDSGTSKKKRIEQLRFRAKRGSDWAETYTPKLMFRYRNNGKATWSNIKEISLGFTGDTDIQIKLFRLGIYESRQFEISCSDNVPVVLHRAEADVTVLR